MKGSALGSCSIQKICDFEVASERIRLMRSSSAERSPTMVLTISGKKATSAALMTLEVRPSPNQTMMSGASATFGIAWNMTMKGYRKYSTRRLSATMVPRANASAEPTRNPSSVSSIVTPKCWA